jgi:hypothetical protein
MSNPSQKQLEVMWEAVFGVLPPTTNGVSTKKEVNFLLQTCANLSGKPEKVFFDAILGVNKGMARDLAVGDAQIRLKQLGVNTV